MRTRAIKYMATERARLCMKYVSEIHNPNKTDHEYQYGHIPLFNKVRLWLEGTFTCIRCGRIHHIFIFGFGKSICPDCYQGERSFLFFDQSYWLNRIITRFLNYDPTLPEPLQFDPALMEHQHDLTTIELH